MGGNNEFFENFERNKYLKKLPSMQRVNDHFTVRTISDHLIKTLIHLFIGAVILQGPFDPAPQAFNSNVRVTYWCLNLC